jgi:hypothetical protein
MKPEILHWSVVDSCRHWSEVDQARHDQRMRRNAERFQDLIFRDLGIQAGRMHREEEKAKRARPKHFWAGKPMPANDAEWLDFMDRAMETAP